jgi:hypothetical protein
LSTGLHPRPEELSVTWVWQLGALARPDESVMEGPARDRHRRHRRLPRPGRRQGEHHATAFTPAGKKAFDKRLPNTEPKLRELFAKLQAKHGTVLVVVDRPALIGALPLAMARDMGCPVAYLPGLTMRRIADLYPGEAKTTRRTRSSSRTPPARCLTLCGPSTAWTRRSPSWR